MLQFITHRNERFPDESEGALMALKGGCRWIQLRMKEAGARDIVDMGKKISAMCREYGATFILDDHVELVDVCGADGVHLGKNDMPVAEARKILGTDSIIGATANTYEDILKAVADGADYIGLGPFRFTTTKEKLSPTLGLEGYRGIIRRCRDTGICPKIVAIGGITPEDLPSLLKTGVSGVAISGAILNAADPIAETRIMMHLIPKT